jgi:chemotaxis signal transduction protein
MRMLPLERVATDSIPALCGLSLIRGEPCPVLDLGRLLGEPQQANRLVLLRVPGSSPTEQPQQRRVALAVSEVIGVSRAERSTLAELPPLLSAASADVVESLSVHDQQLVSILKTASLWSEADWAALEAL